MSQPHRHPQERLYPLEPLFGRLLTPFEQFLRRSTAGGMVLVAATLLTLLFSNSFLKLPYQDFWHQHLALQLGSWRLDHDLQDWVNDALMAVFFFVVGLELKRELLVGELSHWRNAILPIAAAAGGMIVPALLYSLLNAHGPAHAGWGIPMATDIAFAIGILVLLSWRIPKNLIIFLTALAIADDLGAVLVIAIFYTAHLNLWALAMSGFVFLALLLLNLGGIRNVLPYLLLGLVLWYFLLSSGVHAAIAGILLAITIPARGNVSPQKLRESLEQNQEVLQHLLAQEKNLDPLVNDRLTAMAEDLGHHSRKLLSPQQRLEHQISPWVTFGVLPIFALANAGIDFSTVHRNMLWSPITLGVVLGLVFGKFFGITLGSWLSIRIKLATLPPGVSWKHLLGAAWLGGIGFTMSLFISQLAFTTLTMREEAKLGILLGSLLAALLGLGWLFFATQAQKDVHATC